ncbi:MAG: nucleoside recognition domain-containing protein [Bacillota bacterium]|nr:nucleoside recognition domain-containing protein [Bacillota bacterium]
MINIIWFAMLACGIVSAAIQGDIRLVTEATISGAEESVKMAFNLIGIIALWSGLVKIAEDAGLIQMLAKLIQPLTRALFPEIPPDHPAMGAVVLSMSANLLGLGNACTPLGIKAMEELQKLNAHKDTASNSMCTFVAITASSLTLIPTTVIALRAAAKSSNPTAIVGTTIAATAASTAVAIIADMLFRKAASRRFKL